MTAPGIDVEPLHAGASRASLAWFCRLYLFHDLHLRFHDVVNYSEGINTWAADERGLSHAAPTAIEWHASSLYP